MRRENVSGCMPLKMASRGTDHTVGFLYESRPTGKGAIHTNPSRAVTSLVGIGVFNPPSGIRSLAGSTWGKKKMRRKKKTKTKLGICPTCGNKTGAPQTRNFCSRRCQLKENEKYRAKCLRCGIPKAQRHFKGYCSSRCAELAMGPEWEKWRKERDEAKQVEPIPYEAYPKNRRHLYFNWEKTDPFYKSEEWRMLSYRMRAFQRECLRCGSKHRLVVDHIKPRSKYPELALEQSNLQVLCYSCNRSKGNWDETDYRLRESADV